MRQQIVNGIEIEYPEQNIFLHDENNVKITATVGSDPINIGYDMLVINYSTGQRRKLSYRSTFSPTVIVPLQETINSLYKDEDGKCGLSISLQVYINNVLYGQRVWGHTVFKGRTLSYKMHGGNKVMHVYNPDELQNIQIFSNTTMALYFGSHPFHIMNGLNTINLSGYITDPGVYKLCFSPSTNASVSIVMVSNITPWNGIAVLEYDNGTPSDSGEVRIPSLYRGDAITNCLTIVYGYGISEYGEACDSSASDGQWVEIRYRDTDGARRYLAGKVISDELEYDPMDYNRLEPFLLFKKPLRHVQAFRTNITVGLADLERASGFDEVLLSDDIEWRSDVTNMEWRPCKIEDSIIRNGSQDRYDMELSMTVNV